MTAHFASLELHVELALTALNIVSDILLFVVAVRLFLHLRLLRLVRTLVIPLFLVGLILAISAGRLVASILGITKLPRFEDLKPAVFIKLLIPWKLLMELNYVLALFVACLPGLRVWGRRNNERNKNLRDARNGETGTRREIASGHAGNTISMVSRVDTEKPENEVAEDPHASAGPSTSRMRPEPRLGPFLR
jgi:hypothetical protein